MSKLLPPSTFLPLGSWGLGLPKVRAVFLLKNMIDIIKSVVLELLVSLPEYIHVLEKSTTELKLVDPCLALHTVLDAVLSVCSFIGEVKGSEAGWATGLGVVGELVVVAHFSTGRMLDGLEIDSSDGTIAQAPVLNRRHLVDRRAKRLLKTRRLEEVSPASRWRLIRHLEI